MKINDRMQKMLNSSNIELNLWKKLLNYWFQLWKRYSLNFKQTPKQNPKKVKVNFSIDSPL